jgi:hypothetical protein
VLGKYKKTLHRLGPHINVGGEEERVRSEIYDRIDLQSVVESAVDILLKEDSLQLHNDIGLCMQAVLAAGWELEGIPFYEAFTPDRHKCNRSVQFFKFYVCSLVGLSSTHFSRSQVAVGSQRTAFLTARNNLDLSEPLFTRFSNLSLIKSEFDTQPAVAQLVGRRY